MWENECMAGNSCGRPNTWCNTGSIFSTYKGDLKSTTVGLLDESSYKTSPSATELCCGHSAFEPVISIASEPEVCVKKKLCVHCQQLCWMRPFEKQCWHSKYPILIQVVLHHNLCKSLQHLETIQMIIAKRGNRHLCCILAYYNVWIGPCYC